MVKSSRYNDKIRKISKNKETADVVNDGSRNKIDDENIFGRKDEQ